MATTLNSVLSKMDETSITTADELLIIDPDTRQISVPGIELVFGVQYDDSTDRKYFQCPRYVGNNLDLASCFIRVNYRNANGEMDCYLVDDVTVDGDYVTFSWLVSQKVLLYKGQVKFLVCAVGPDLKMKWHTTLATGISLEGQEPDGAAIKAGTADVVAQLIAMVEQQTTAVEEVGAEWVRNVQSEGTDQINAVQTAAREAQTASVAEIEAKGVNTLGSIPESYTAVQNAVDGLVRGRAGAIVCEASGETVMVSDASDLPMLGLRVFGKTTQATTTGKNLLDMTNEKLLIVGTSGVERYGYSFDGPGTYTFSCVGDNATSITCKIVSDGVFGEYKSFVLTANYTATLGENDTLLIYRAEENVRLSAGIKNAQIEVGSVATDYEPYSGGKPSPSPDYPQELVSLEPVVRVCGNNLCNLPDMAAIEINGVTWTYQDGKIMANGTTTAMSNVGPSKCPLNLLPGTYTVSGGVDGVLIIVHRQRNGVKDYFTSKNGNAVTFDVIEDDILYLYGQVSNGIGVSNVTAYPMVNVGETALPWEPYKALQTVELTHTLPGIPVTSDGNYTDSDGQQWICDEVDLERGVYVQRVKEQIINRTPYFAETADLPGRFNWYCLSGEYKNGRADAILNFAKWSAWGGAIKGIDSGGVSINQIYYTPAVTMTVDEVNAKFAKMISDGTPPVIVGQLETPIETALSETEIAAYRALHSSYPNTTVLNDSGAHMVVKYAADTKLYIDNKIAALVGGA